MNMLKIARWIMIADRDLEDATCGVGDESAVFYFHQSTEGYLIAFLLLRGEDRNRKSDIAGLLLKCAIHDVGFLEFADFASEMTSFATRYVYPQDTGEVYVDPTKARKAEAFAQRVQRLVLSRIPAEVIALAEERKRNKPSHGLDAPTGE